MIVLHQLRRCPWAAAVRQALANVGVDYGTVQVPYRRDLRAEVRALTGQELTPVLVDGEAVVAGSQRIVAHLYATYGDATQRTRARELMGDLSPTAPPACPVGA
ncbi:MAG: glutathione S-transferase N-terminal domain-containing protein [Actinomycetota bacterium]